MEKNLNNEEKKAIENAENTLKEWKEIIDIEDNIERNIEIPFNTIKILLTLITKLQEENEKKDKVINEIIKLLLEFDIDEIYCDK